jgi:hypothetical protein
MKRILFLCMVAIILSCKNDKPKGADSTIYTEKQVSDFLSAYPTWTTADAEITEKFKHRMINLSNEDDFLKAMPFKLIAIRDSLFSGQSVKVAIFETYKDDSRNDKSLLNDLDLQISGLVSDAQISQLKIDQKYYISGTMYKQGKRASVDLVENNNSKTYRLGNYAFLITGYKAFHK